MTNPLIPLLGILDSLVAKVAKGPLRTEPVAVAGVLTAVANALNGAATWTDAWPLLAALVLRSFVTPAHR